MKKLLILTGSDKENVLAHSHFLRSFANEEDDVHAISPQEIAMLNEEIDKLPYDDVFHTAVKVFENQKDFIFEEHGIQVLIVFGTVAKGTFDWYDAVVGVGYTYVEDNIIHKRINTHLPKNVAKVPIKLTTPYDAPVVIYDKQELRTFIRHFIKVSKKELADESK